MASDNIGSRAKGPSIQSSTAVLSTADPRVTAALEEFVQLLRSGQRLDRAEFLALHQPIADALVECLDGLEFVQVAAGEFAATGSRSMAMEDRSAPSRLGEYRVIREVGRGGMGVVYEAEQLPLGRRVALKVLPSAASLDPRQRQRFQVEAQAAALLHHEHIVPVFGIGCDHGVHYYAMQFIDGRPLTEIIRDLRPVSTQAGLVESMNSAREPALGAAPEMASPSNSGSSAIGNRQHFQMAARLGFQAAEALAHAHDVGVIHRDIKPSNLLIGARGHLWVADFGLAHLPQDDHDLTRTGDLIGTLRYMSPEQARGAPGGVDPRTDIYALGVTLYELLTLRPAFGAPDRQELLRCILHDEPIPPRCLNPATPRDLETIILKAMEKEPSARYGSARELCDDLRRFIDDQPIRARRPSLLDRAVKWSRRHRTAVVAAAVALLLALAATTVVLWEANRRTAVAMELHRVAANNAIASVTLSLGIVDQLTHTAAFSTRGEPTHGAVYDDARRTALYFYDTIAKTFSAGTRMQELAARACRSAGYTRMVLGDPRGRLDYRHSIRIYEDIAAQSPGLLWLRTALIDTLQEYASLLTAPEHADEADGSIRHALEIAVELIENRDIEQHCFRMGLINPLNNLSWGLVRRTSVSPSDAALAVRLARKAADWEPTQAALWNTLGVACYRTGNWSAAASALQRAMDLKGGGDAADWFFLAALHHRQGDTKQARQWYDRAVARMQQSPDPDKAVFAELRGFRDEVALVIGCATLAAEQRERPAHDNTPCQSW